MHGSGECKSGREGDEEKYGRGNWARAPTVVGRDFAADQSPYSPFEQCAVVQRAPDHHERRRSPVGREARDLHERLCEVHRATSVAVDGACVGACLSRRMPCLFDPACHTSVTKAVRRAPHAPSRQVVERVAVRKLVRNGDVELGRRQGAGDFRANQHSRSEHTGQ